MTPEEQQSLAGLVSESAKMADVTSQLSELLSPDREVTQEIREVVIRHSNRPASSTVLGSILPKNR